MSVRFNSGRFSTGRFYGGRFSSNALLGHSLFTFDTSLIAGETIQIYTNTTASDLEVDWGDDSSETIVTGAQTTSHLYAAGGVYEVKIKGAASQIRVGGLTSSAAVTRCDSIGFGHGLTTMAGMFQDCANLTSVPPLIPSGIQSMFECFLGCTLFNADVRRWNVSSVTDMTTMLRDCTAFDQPFTSWDVTSLTTAENFLLGVTLSTANYDDVLINWEGQAVQNNVSINFGSSQYSDTAAATARQALIDDHSWTIVDGGFLELDHSLFTFDTSLIAGETIEIYTNTAASDLEIDWGDGSSDTILTGVQTTSHTYAAGGVYEVTVTNAVVRIKVGDLTSAAAVTRCDSIGFAHGLNSMTDMFKDCTNLTYAPPMIPTGIGPMNSIFRDCSSFNSDITAWDTSSATTLNSILRNTIVDQDLSSWDITSVTTATLLLHGVTLSTPNYDATLIGWEGQAVQNNVSVSFGSSQYSAGAAATARQALINDHTWTIVDGGQI